MAAHPFELFVRGVHRRMVVLRACEGVGLGVLGGCVVALLLMPVLIWRGQPTAEWAGWAVAAGGGGGGGGRGGVGGRVPPVPGLVGGGPAAGERGGWGGGGGRGGGVDWG